MSNLVSEDERSLDAMDPYQRDAKTIGKNDNKLMLLDCCHIKCACQVLISPWTFVSTFQNLVWEKIMRGEFKLPPKILNPTGTVMSSKPSSIKAVHQQNQKAVIDNDVYSSPYEVRVRPPADFVPPQASSATIIRFGRSVTQPDEELLPVLSEEDAHQLIGSLHWWRSDVANSQRLASFLY